MDLLEQVRKPRPLLSSREERAVRREVAAILQSEGISDPEHRADVLVQMGAQHSVEQHLGLLRHTHCDKMLQTASNIATVIDSTNNINAAVERVAKIVFALKSFSRADSSGEMVDANIRDGLDTVLTIYQNQIRHGVDLVRHYAEVPLLRCLPDQLNQVWTNLIHNSLQAMKHKGCLTVDIAQQGQELVVSIGDSGCGIPQAIRDRIFEPFFTTKPTGEGSGLGLDIVKKIVDKHKGRITVSSELGVGTTFSVYLPLDRADTPPNVRPSPDVQSA
jgi:signal transduction histidine kinase